MMYGIRVSNIETARVGTPPFRSRTDVPVLKMLPVATECLPVLKSIPSNDWDTKRAYSVAQSFNHIGVKAV